MKTKFNIFEIFQIAEQIEHNWAKFYLKTAEMFDDSERRNIYYKLANWKAKHEKALAKRRKDFSEKTGQLGTFDPDDYVASNPHAMAALAAFATEPGSEREMMGSEGKKEIIRDAISRSKQAIVFYRGLKDFAREMAGQDTIEQIIKEETQHINALIELIEQKQ